MTVPTLVIHGDDDQIAPIDTTARRAAELLPQGRLLVYEGGPHGLAFTRKDRLNADLLAFLSAWSGGGTPAQAGSAASSVTLSAGGGVCSVPPAPNSPVIATVGAAGCTSSSRNRAPISRPSVTNVR
jgi:fermentation-respiration switch protein FrsA (DUF1100 family)